MILSNLTQKIIITTALFSRSIAATCSMDSEATCTEKITQTTIFNHHLSPLSMYYVTTNTMESAQQISSALVSSKLAACVNIVGSESSPGVTSVYHWDGKINTDQEYMLIIKSRTALLQEIANQVTKLHSYDVPEIIGTPIFGGSKAYIDWVLSQTKEPNQADSSQN